MAPMVEADRDGRLDARERSSLARHLASCESCRALVSDLERLRDLAARPRLPPVTELEHQRGRLALLRAGVTMGPQSTSGAPNPGLLRRPFSRPAARMAGGIVLVAAVGAIVIASKAVTLGPQSTLGAPNPRPAETASQATGTTPAPSDPAPQATGVQKSARTETRVTGSEEARFERSSTVGVERVELSEGAVDLEVRPLVAGERFLVATGDAEVEVRGTVFHVEAHSRRLTRVSVSEGKVEVRYAGAMITLEAGSSWSASPDGSGAANSPKLRPQTTGASPSATVPVTDRGKVASTGSAAAAASAAPAGASSFGEGVRLIERGDYAAAAEKLDAFRLANPGDQRAEDAAYLSILALQRAGRREAAVEAARRYLDRYPHGFRRAEAQAIIAASPH